jgi:transcriptional regulator with XRE-family HTH domain
MISREQLRMARSALGWSVRDLSERTGLGTATVSRFENGADAYSETLRKIEAVLEAEGVRFGKDDDGGLWVRLTPGFLSVRRQDQT